MPNSSLNDARDVSAVSSASAPPAQKATPPQHASEKYSTLKAVSGERSDGTYRSLVTPYTTALVLDPEGFVKHLTDGTRRLLGYGGDKAFDPYFFTHVHGRNLPRVMRDLASMVKHGMSKTSWLLRLRTGRDGRWRWFRAQVTNRLDFSPPGITVRLHALHE